MFLCVLSKNKKKKHTILYVNIAILQPQNSQYTEKHVINVLCCDMLACSHVLQLPKKQEGNLSTIHKCCMTCFSQMKGCCVLGDFSGDVLRFFL